MAYAVTIHKSQGLTLDKARISLDSVFEYGQAYGIHPIVALGILHVVHPADIDPSVPPFLYLVALSRLRGLKGVELEDWAPKAIKAHPRVLK